MLTEVERERLINRDGLAMSVKKGNEFIVRKKIKSWLDDIDDINFILAKLPDKQLNKMISNKIVFSLMDLAANLLFILGALPVIENEYVPSGRQVRQTRQADIMTRPSIRRGFYEVMRKAQPEELERRDYLVNHIISLIDTLSDDDASAIVEDILSTRPELTTPG